MTREEAEDFNKHKLVFRQSQIPFLKHIDKIYNDFETANCKNCKWLKDEVCVNADSLKCADYPDVEMMCNEWEKKDV